MACLISTGSSQKICCSCTAAMFHAMKNNLFFPYRLLRSSVRLTLSFITRIMTILYILHKKKRLYGLDEKQIIKYLFYKISLDTAQMNTHRFKISPCAFADRSPDVKLFVFFAVGTVATSIDHVILGQCPTVHQKSLGERNWRCYLVSCFYLCAFLNRATNWTSAYGLWR